MISSARSFRTSLPKLVLGLIAIAAVGCSSSKSTDNTGNAGGAGPGPSTGLLLWLKLDEASTNGTIADSSGNMNMATYGTVKPVVVSTVPAALKSSAAALKFDGTATVDIAPTASLKWVDNTSNYSISLWANPTALPVAPNWDSAISNNPGGTNPGYCGIAIAPDGMWSFEANGQDVASGGISVRGAAAKVGVWQHIVIVQNGTATMGANTIYVDGVAGPTNARGPSPCNSDVGFSLGFKDGDGFVGMIDDVRIYGQALTEAQVKDLAAGKEPTL